MLDKNVFITVIILLCYYQASYSQEKTVEKDTTKLYRKIETFSKKKKVTKLLYKLIFNSITKTKKSNKRLI